MGYFNTGENISQISRGIVFQNIKSSCELKVCIKMHRLKISTVLSGKEFFCHAKPIWGKNNWENSIKISETWRKRQPFDVMSVSGQVLGC